MFRYHLRDQTGQAIIELALLVPIFTILLIGAAEFGRLAYASIEVANAARAGASYGAQSHTTASDTAGIQAAALQDAPNVGGITATVAPLTCSCSNSATPITCSTANPTTVCKSPDRILESVQVSTTATVSVGFHIAGTATSFTVHGLANMRVEE